MSVQDVSLSKTYRKSKTEIYALTKKVRFSVEKETCCNYISKFS